MKLINPFGPKIAILKIPKNLINEINKEFEKILLSKIPNLNHKKLGIESKLG